MGQTEVKMEKKGMPLEDAQYQLKISRDTEVINPPPPSGGHWRENMHPCAHEL